MWCIVTLSKIMTEIKTASEIIYGINPIQELLKAKRRKIYGIYTTRPTPKAFVKLEAEFKARNIPIKYVSRDQLTRQAGTSEHQGIIALASPFAYRSKPFDPARHSFLLLLDGIQDPRNLGAILRSAYCTGVDGVIITQKSSAPLNAVALKASAGLAEHLEIMKSPSPVNTAQELKKNGYQLYVAAFDGQNILDTSFKLPMCIVIGSEGEGVSPSLIKLGTTITIPQKRADISYNASVAAGIILFYTATLQKKI